MGAPGARSGIGSEPSAGWELQPPSGSWVHLASALLQTRGPRSLWARGREAPVAAAAPRHRYSSTGMQRPPLLQLEGGWHAGLPLHGTEWGQLVSEAVIPGTESEPGREGVATPASWPLCPLSPCPVPAPSRPWPSAEAGVMLRSGQAVSLRSGGASAQGGGLSQGNSTGIRRSRHWDGKGFEALAPWDEGCCSSWWGTMCRPFP